MKKHKEVSEKFLKVSDATVDIFPIVMLTFSLLYPTIQAVGCVEGIGVKVYKVKPKGYKKRTRTIAIIIEVCLLLSIATISVLCSMDEF